MTAVGNDGHLDTPWLVTAQPRPRALLRMFCFPHAGAAASVYRHWADRLDPRVAVHAVQLPGREHRFHEPAELDLAAMTAAIRVALDRPYAMFGHSMGARLAFEVVRRLRAAGAPLPRVLFASAARPPDQPDDGPLAGISRADDETMMRQLASAGALPAEVAADPDLRELFAPMIRADFRWLDEYDYRSQPPLPVPIIALAGADDTLVKPDLVRGWQRHTTAGFTLHTFPGDHFYLHERPDEPLALVRRSLLQAATRAQP